MKRTLSLALAVLMLLALMSACGSSPSAAPTVTSTPAPSSTAGSNPSSEPALSGFEGYDGVDNLKISEDPATLSLFSAFTIESSITGDLPIWQKAAEITNISIENVANPNIVENPDSHGESLGIFLSGGKLADLMYAMKEDMIPVVQQGGLIPLNDLIEEHAPNIKRYFDAIPEARVGSTNVDGKTYFIEGSLAPSFNQNESLVPTQMFFIRKDWLDKLSLPVPTTLDGLKDTLYAFRNDDPNGNGKKDEIPFFFRNGSPVGLYQLFGVNGDWAQWSIDAADKVIFGRTSEEYKNALRELAIWYKDGIIDPELLSRGSQARQELLGNDTGGCTFDWYESTANMNYNEDILALVPEINWEPILPPADVNGVVKNVYSDAPVDGNVWGISKDCKDPVAAIKFMDFWFTKTGSILMQYGIEGVSYNMVDGEPKYSDEAYAFGAGIPNYMRTLGAGGSVAGVYDYDVSQKTEMAQHGYHLYVDSGVLIEPFPTLNYTEEENDVIAQYWGQVDTLVNEYEQQVLYGEKDVDASWAGYIAEMNALGLQEIVAVRNAAYQRYKEAFGN